MFVFDFGFGFVFIYSHMMFIPMNHTKHQSLIEPRRLNHFGDESNQSDQPPPLPVKKKHSKLSFLVLVHLFENAMK